MWTKKVFPGTLFIDVCWHIFYVSVGRPKHVRVMAGALEGDIFIGPKAEVCAVKTTAKDFLATMGTLLKVCLCWVMDNELRIVLIVCFFCKILAQAELDYWFIIYKVAHT